MKDRSLTTLFLKTMTQVIAVLVIINIVNLISELIRLENFKDYNLTYMHGYFVLNGNQVGLNIFANLLSLVLLSVIIMFYRANKQRSAGSLN